MGAIRAADQQISLNHDTRLISRVVAAFVISVLWLSRHLCFPEFRNFAALQCV